MEERVEFLAAGFVQRYNALLANYPKYRLDLSWPSIGVVDLIIQGLRGKKQLTTAEDGLLLSASAYLAELAYTIWSRFHEDLKVELVFEERPRPSVKIEGKGGPLLPEGHLVFVNITETLRELLENTPSPLPFFEQSARTVPPDHNLLSVIAPGILSGVTPFARGSDHVGYMHEGVWAKRSAAEMQRNILIAATELALRSAVYYQRNFPSEPHGQDSNLYVEANLIFPPAGYNEPFPAMHAALGLARFIKEHGISHDEAAVLSENLSIVPDELMGSAGFALSAALAGSAPLRPGIYNAHCLLGSYRSSLRPAILLAREALEIPGDFFKLAAMGRFEPALRLLKLDHTLGLMPLLRLPYEYIQHRELLPLYNALALGQHEEALGFLEGLLESQAVNIDLVLQQAHLYLAAGDLENAEGALRLAEKGPKTEDPGTHALFLELAATLQMAMNEHDRAIPLLERCLELADPYSPSFRSAAHMLCWAMALKGYTERAVDRATEILNRAPHILEVRVIRHALLEGTDVDRWEEETRALARMLPSSQPIFNSVLRLEQQQAAQ